jgi:hypothetical protein
MSPTAIATVVEVVGAETPKVLSSDSCIGAGSSMASGLPTRSWQEERFVCDVSAMIGTDTGMWCTIVKSSGVLPEKVTKRTASFCGGLLDCAPGRRDNLDTCRSNIPEVSMHSFRCMEKRTPQSQALHGGYYFHTNVAAFPHAADNQLAAGIVNLDDAVNGFEQARSRGGISLIEPRSIRERSSFGGDNVHRSIQRTCALWVIERGRGCQGHVPFPLAPPERPV